MSTSRDLVSFYKVLNGLDSFFGPGDGATVFAPKSPTLLMEELLRRNFRMASRIELHKRIIEVYQKKVAEKEERVCSLNRQLTTSQAECASLSTRIDGLQEAKVRSAQEHEEKTEALEAQFNESSAEIAVLSMEVSQKKAMIRKLEGIAQANTARHLAGTVELRNQLDCTSRELEATQNSLTLEISKLEAQMGDIMDKQTKTEDEMARVSAKLAATEEELTTTKQKFASEETTRNELRATLDLAEKDNINLRGFLEETREELAKATQELAGSRGQVSELHVALGDAQGELGGMKIQLGSVQLQLVAQKSELEETRRNWKEESGDLTAKLDAVQEELTTAKDNLGITQYKLREATIRISDQDSNRKMVREEFDAYKQEADACAAKLGTSVNTLEAKIDEVQEELADVRNELQNTYIKLDEAIADASEKSVQLLEKEVLIRDTQSRLIAVNGDFKMFKEKAGGQTADLEGRIQALKDDLTTKDVELENNRDKLDAYSDEISALKTELANKDNALEQAYIEHQSEMEDVNDCTDDLWDLLDEKNSEIRDIKEDLEPSKDMVAILTEELAKRDKTIASLRAESNANVHQLMARIVALESQLQVTPDCRTLVVRPLEPEIDTMLAVDVTDTLFPVDVPKCALPPNKGYFESLAPLPSYDAQNNDERAESGDAGPSQLEPTTQNFFRIKPRGGMPFMVRPPYYPRRKKVRNGRVVGYEDPTPTNYRAAIPPCTETRDAGVAIARPQAEVVSDHTTPVAVPHQSLFPLPAIRPDAPPFSHSPLFPRLAELHADTPSFTPPRNEPSAASSSPHQLPPISSPQLNANVTSFTPPKRQILRLDAAAFVPRQLSPSPSTTQLRGDAASFAPCRPSLNLQPQLLSLDVPTFIPGASIWRQPPGSLSFDKSPQVDSYSQIDQSKRFFMDAKQD